MFNNKNLNKTIQDFKLLAIKMNFHCLLLLLTCLASVCDGGGTVLEIKSPSRTLASLLGGNTSLLLEYYTPWCGHCAELEADVAAVARAFDARRDGVVVARMNADKHRAIATAHGVRAFPMFAWFPAGGTEAEREEYDGALTVRVCFVFNSF
jgi:thiol:disulfide interchange protein